MRRTESTTLVGAHAESQFISYALEQRWEVAHPFVKSAPYDSLIRRSPEVPWETVQVKRAYYTKKTGMKVRVLEVGLRRATTRSQVPYKDGDFDWLFVFHEDGKWFMPWDLIRGKKSSMIVSSARYDLWRV